MAKKNVNVNGNLQAILDKIEKDFGKGTVIRAGEAPHRTTEAISTGSFGLDLALGVGGLPKGRITEIYGGESAGKTTLCLQTIANGQKEGLCGFIDTEHALDLEYARKLGVDIDNLYLCQPDYGEQALEILERLLESREFAVLVVDSVAALVPKAELDGDMGDNRPGGHARLMSQAMRKLAATVARSRSVVIFTNQLREKIGVMFGTPETTTGGNALKFYASIRVDIRKGGQIKKEDEDSVGNTTRVKVVKNKVSSPFRTAEFDIIYGEGVYYAKEILEAAVEAGIVQKSGSWYAYGDGKLGQGSDNALTLLRDNYELFSEIEQKTIFHYYATDANGSLVGLETT